MAHSNPRYDGPLPSATEIEDMLTVPELRGLITRLRLQPGDILLIHDPDIMDGIINLRMPINFPVPIVFAPEGSISSIGYDRLVELVAQLSATRQGGASD